MAAHLPLLCCPERRALPLRCDDQAFYVTRAHLDYLRARHGEAERIGQQGSEQFVRQNAQVLGVVLKLGDVEGLVVAAQQMRLGTAAHSSHVLESASQIPFTHACSCREEARQPAPS